jgi:chemotaxis protein methyltransferase CheR
MELMARTLANEGKLADALTWCDRVVAAANLDPAGHFLRANVLHEQGDMEEAARSYRRALYLDPDFALAHFALGNLSKERGSRDEAWKHFRHALRVLESQSKDHVLPESEGVTAGRLAEIISSLLETEAAHER